MLHLGSPGHRFDITVVHTQNLLFGVTTLKVSLKSKLTLPKKHDDISMLVLAERQPCRGV